jgi:hypothetical protein
MELGQPLVRNLQLDAPGGIGFDDVDKVPGNLAWRDTEEQGAQGDCGDHAFEEPPDSATRTDIHAADSQDRTILGAVMMEIDVIDAHHLAAVNVNHLLVQQVAAEQQAGPLDHRRSSNPRQQSRRECLH